MALPSGYTKLEYIESTGTQYINTGFVPSSTVSVVIDFNSSVSSGVIIGQDSGYKVKGFMLAMTVVVFDSTKKDLSISANNRHVVQLDPKNFKIDNGASSVIDTRTFNGAYPLFLFGNNRSGAFSEGVSMRLYACQIYDSNAVEFDFIPCKNASGVVGMWDDANSQFYTNAGTGEFVAGPEELKAGPLSSRSIGSSVYLNVGGVKKEFLVVHQGLPSSLYDASCDGTWLLMKDCYENRQWNSSNSNIYETSTINTYLNGTFFGLFDADIQKLIKQVKIPYRKGGGFGGTDQSGANGLSCKVFLLSGPEVGLAGVSYMPNDGAKLDYFNANTGTDSKRIAYLNGAATHWWLRSPDTNDASYVWYVSANGNYNRSSAANSRAIRPCIILPSTAQVDDSGNVVTVDLTAHKTLVGGTAYTVQGGKCMVNGTVYNILKGRTLIDGTGWDITFPSAVVMPAKGDLITMNLDGTDRLYRILSLDGDIAKVFTIGDLTSGAFDTNGYHYYFGNALDAYLNTTWYNRLTSNAKAAIQSVSITQASWQWTGSGTYKGTYGETIPGTNPYGLSEGAFSGGTNFRYIYALSIRDILDYLDDASLRVDQSGALRNVNLWNMLWDRNSGASNNIWLRDFDSTSQYAAFAVSGSNGLISPVGTTAPYGYRPAFQIDLSKIDFAIGGVTVSKTWTFDTSKAPTTMFPNLSAGSNQVFSVSFTSNGQQFIGFRFYHYYPGDTLGYATSSGGILVYDLEEGWFSAYKTVTFDEAPSGDLLTWLQANATPQ